MQRLCMWKPLAPLLCVTRATCLNTMVCGKARVGCRITPAHGTEVTDLCRTTALARRPESPIVLWRPKPTSLLVLPRASQRHLPADAGDLPITKVEHTPSYHRPRTMTTKNPNPGDFSFMKDNMTRMMMEDMWAAVTAAEAWDDIKADPGDGGFMFGARDLTTRITAKLNDRVGHSGASFAYTLRYLQAIARDGWASWVHAQQETAA